MAVRTEKTQAERITECMTVIRKLTDEVRIPATNPSIRVLQKRMAQYWRDGLLQEDKLPLYGYDRVIVYRLPKWSNQIVEVTLKVSKVRHPRLPSDLEAELQVGMNNVSQSDPSCPSLPESIEK